MRVCARTHARARTRTRHPASGPVTLRERASQAGPGGVRYVPTVQVAMRKDLRRPPADTVAAAAAAIAAAAYLGAVLHDDAAAVAALVADGRAGAALEWVGQLVTAALPSSLPGLRGL